MHVKCSITNIQMVGAFVNTLSANVCVIEKTFLKTFLPLNLSENVNRFFFYFMLILLPELLIDLKIIISLLIITNKYLLTNKRKIVARKRHTRFV